MKAEILSIGTELTSGQNLDTNSQWLSQRLSEIGILTAFHTTVGDDLGDNLDVIQNACRRTDLVLITGGLGPTLDDLTREVLAKTAGVQLVFDEASFRHIQDLFAKRNRTMPERNRVQAMFPAGAEVIPNPVGTAPGIWMTIGSATVVAMPGVPSEMRLMFEEHVLPRLTARGFSHGVMIQKKINTFGAGESAVEELLKDITRRGQVPEVGITASDATISLRIIARGANRAEAEAVAEPVERVIRQRLGNLVYGSGDEELQDVVVRLLKEKNRSVATAESITAGLVANRIAHVPGASQWLRGGIVCYDSRVKMSLLGVPESMLQAHSAVSAEVAEHLAVSVRARLSADLGLSVVGYAGPEGGGPGKPVGLVYVGLASEDTVRTHTFTWGGTRLEIQSRAAKMALNALRLHLLSH